MRSAGPEGASGWVLINRLIFEVSYCQLFVTVGNFGPEWHRSAFILGMGNWTGLMAKYSAGSLGKVNIN